MACVSPPELGDAELLAYLDGEASDQVVAHLERCPHCRQRAHRLARFQGRLTARLYRLACPSPEELGEYYLRLLPADQAEAVSQHLAECPRCARELAQLRDYLAELAPDLESTALEQIRDRVRVLVAELVRGRWGIGPLEAPQPVPAFAGIRGGEEEGPQVYQAEDVEVAIDVQEDAERPGRRVMLGLVTGMDTANAQAHIWQAGRPGATAPVDELGNFVIPDLAPGHYKLILSGPAVEIHIQELEI